MDRSVSPLYLHVSRKTPVHVHLRPRKRSPKRGGGESERKRLDQSFAEMAAGRPSLRATSTVSRMKASDWAKASSSRGPWVPPPARSTKPRMAWEGPTHRLEINPPHSGDAQNGTVLRMSDLSPGNTESTDIVLEEGEDGYEAKVNALASEVGALKAKVDNQHSLRALEDKEAELRASLREKEVEIQSFQEELLESEREKHKLKTSMAMMKGDVESSPRAKHLAQRLAESEATSQLLQSQLQEKDKLALHSQALHNEIQTMSTRVQSLEDQLHQRDLECEELEGGMQEIKRKAQRDKEALKRATRQHKDRAIQSEQSVEALGNQLEDANGELQQLRGKLSKSKREKIKTEAEISTLTMRVNELQEALTESKISSQSSLDAVSARLMEKTHELNSTQLETDRFKAKVNSLEGQLRTLDSTSQTRTSTLESEVSQLQASVTQYEGLVTEYKNQLERSRKECEDLARELRRKDQEMERVKQESQMEVERVGLPSINLNLYYHQ